MALVAGGSPRTVDAFYDVAYDRVLAPPAKTTGNGVAGGQCMPKTPNGTRTEYEEGIDAVQRLESTSPATNNIAGIGEIFSGPGIAQMFTPPGLPPKGDPRTPDIIVQPNIGVTYSGSTKKLAEHGGFAHDDLNVIMLVSDPSMSPSTVASPVETTQVAPTILSALGLDPNNLTAVQQEGTQILPGLGLDGGKSPY